MAGTWCDLLSEHLQFLLTSRTIHPSLGWIGAFPSALYRTFTWLLAPTMHHLKDLEVCCNMSQIVKFVSRKIWAKPTHVWNYYLPSSTETGGDNAFRNSYGWWPASTAWWYTCGACHQEFSCCRYHLPAEWRQDVSVLRRIGAQVSAAGKNFCDSYAQETFPSFGERFRNASILKQNRTTSSRVLRNVLRDSKCQKSVLREFVTDWRRSALLWWLYV